MIDQCAPIPSDLRLNRLVEDHVLAGDQRCFFVTDSDDPQGVITINEVKGVSREQREQVTAGQVMTPANAAFAANTEDDVWSLLQKMNEDGVTTVPNLENGRLLGVITPENLWSQVRLRGELAA